MILLTACVCLQEKFNLHVHKVKPLFQLRSKEDLGTEFTAVPILSNLLDDSQHGLPFKKMLVMLNSHQLPPSNASSLL